MLKTQKAQTKTGFKPSKTRPFGANYLTKLSSTNGKLMCNLSRAGCDVITDDPDAQR